jgi:hypothetical protein
VICLCPIFRLRLLKWLGKSERLETFTINSVKDLKLSDYSGLLFDLVICLFWHATLRLLPDYLGLVSDYSVLLDYLCLVMVVYGM